MNELVTKKYDEILSVLDVVEVWSARILKVLLTSVFLLGLLSPNVTAFADGPPGAAGAIVDVFTDLGHLVIKICYALMVVLFSVGTVKSGVGAQAAQAFGATHKVSFEMLNIVGGIVIFVFGLLTLPIVNTIIDKVTAKVGTDTESLIISNPYAP